MIKCSKRTREGWLLVDDMVRRWMQQRIQLTQDFEAVVTPREVEEPVSDLSGRLSLFCQTLVDYVSAGHFEVYNELISEAREFNDGSAITGIDLCSAIDDSTDMALEFNDKYISDTACRKLLAALPKDLVELGNALNLRFELEDNLIAAVHESHRPMVA